MPAAELDNGKIKPEPTHKQKGNSRSFWRDGPDRKLWNVWEREGNDRRTSDAQERFDAWLELFVHEGETLTAQSSK